MIVINCPMKQDFVIEEVTKNPSFTFVKKNGMSLFFNVENMDEATAITQIKSIIKATEIGKILYFTVESRDA